MSRSGYTEDCDDDLGLGRWRGQVASAMRGKRGQAFLREMAEALDAMPEKRLIANDLQKDGEVCAIGSVGARRAVEMEVLDPEDHYRLADVFGIARPMVCEIEFMNDDYAYETPEQRWQRMRDWVAVNILEWC